MHNSKDIEPVLWVAGNVVGWTLFSDRIMRPSYVLVALVDPCFSQSVAIQVFRDFGVNIGEYRGRLLEYIKQRGVVSTTQNEPRRWSAEMTLLSKEAEAAATSWGNNTVGTGHYLYALTKDPELQDFWKAEGLNLTAMRNRIEHIYRARIES